MAAWLSIQGNATLVPDSYDGVLARDDQRAEWASLARSRAIPVLRAAIAYLENRPDIRRDRIGLIGFCMGGGTMALDAAPEEPSLAALVVYYGLPSDMSAANRV